VVRTAGVVGLGWGVVHLDPLRRLGIDVRAVADRSQDRAERVAAEHGIPLATTDVAALDALDLVVVATPAITHPEVLAALPRPAIYLEKPVVGMWRQRAELPASAARALTTYAFAYLPSARVAEQALPSIGPLRAVHVATRVDLPLPFTVEEWALETASHPLSWVLHLLGEPTVQARRSDERTLEVALIAGGVPVDHRVLLAGPPGIEHVIELVGEAGTVRVRGAFAPGQVWRFDPVQRDGTPLDAGVATESDCWQDALGLLTADVVAVFRGELGRADAARRGVFDVGRALWLETAFGGG
jgi:dTDP-4-dehydrorhamnose reductase